jgi:hypothetical protein
MFRQKWAWVENVIARGDAEVAKAAFAVRHSESYGAWVKALEDIGWRDEFAENRVTFEQIPGQVLKPSSGLVLGAS